MILEFDSSLFLVLNPEFPEYADEFPGPEYGDPYESALPKQCDWEHQKASGHKGEPGSCL